ncbi:MAG: 16S rRNA (cytosine(1402)-N(4))-methyltransferase RsmH [Eubacteriales bacterium]|nr:16S rRNA (cytosine(1402)-N(4))-methyltransferase RsmH [Eubacteriales bacterium]
MDFNHVPVLAAEIIENLHIKPDGIYFDGTLGGGGHSSLICSHLSSGRLIATDRDSNAIKAASDRLAPYMDRVTIVKDNFSNAKYVLDNLDIDGIDGAMLDLGVSSHQLDEPERGFSYRFDAPLDMRMDTDAPLSAYEVVNEYSQQDLTRIIFDYGEDKNARKIAKKIVEKRPIRTTLELVEVIKSAFSPQERHEGKHPAKRTFQAIRIEVNNELDMLSGAISRLADKLSKGSRLCIITFHSLEDRIVKTTFNQLSQGCTCPKDFPVCVCGNEPKFRVVTRKPILPSEKELAENPRSASSKLRVLERI